MPYELEHRLVVGVASSALFDLTDSHAAFLEGLEAYQTYQEKHEEVPLRPGVAFPFVKRLLDLNDLSAGDPLVEVIVLSKNDPITGLRVMSSVAHHGLPISRAIFTEGQSPHRYMAELNMSLFLSGSRTDVESAISLGFPAGVVLGWTAVDDSTADDSPSELRVAFDFDGVLADDEAEKVFQSKGLEAFHMSERANRVAPHNPGPLHSFIIALKGIQEVERRRAIDNPDYIPRVRVSIVTARNAPAHERAVTTLRDWGVRVHDAFFLGGISKDRILRVLRPHIFFDDQRTHLEPVQDVVGCVLVPYGIANASESLVIDEVRARAESA